MGLLEDVVARLRTALAGDSRPGPARLVPGSVGLGARHFPTGFAQPDQTTCGSSCLVMARMLGDAAYSRWIESGVDGGGQDGRTSLERFADEAMATHRRTNRWADAAGSLQVAWPRRLGTTPWAVARELRSTGGTAPPGTSHRVRLVAPGDRATAFEEVAYAVRRGHAVPVFVGNRLRPGHVVLALGVDDARLTAYDPATGRRALLRREDFAAGTLGVSGWSEPWFTVLPLSR